MNDDDLRRRLEKLVALRDHPSTLPAIRDEASKAYEKLRAKIQEGPEATYYRYRPWRDYRGVPIRFEGEMTPMERHIMDELEKQTQRMVFPWDIHKPERE